ncbi:DNA polymerase III subunit [Salisaeta longa]|uniref:DNA polymerase III subunit n=1 Tax=Salisaeta longa TaxID=503170 RepID=UPI0003B6A360|nr:DNA polymerase III subunit delta' [Salisaeta longa]
MAWTALIEQERVERTLRRTLAQERVAHAYLFHGPAGVGKRAAALEMARALECTEQRAEACESCAACRKTRRMVHPDVHVLMPHPWSQEGKRDEDDMAQRIKRLGDNPYAPVGYAQRPSLDDPTATSNKQVLYRIDQVHNDLLRPMSLHAGEGRYKVGIVPDVHRMREEGANAFLKLLEEPPPRTVFLLTTHRPQDLLPTITSRCQKLRFDMLSEAAIQRGLRRYTDVADERGAMLARMADGSLERALALHENEALLEHRMLVLEYLRSAYTQSTQTLNSQIQRLRNSGRESLKNALQLMLRWVRDLILYRALGTEAPLVNVDQREAIARFCDNLPDANLEAMVILIEEALALTTRNVRIELVLTTLAQALARVMRGLPADGLYVSLPAAAAQRKA